MIATHPPAAAYPPFPNPFFSTSFSSAINSSQELKQQNALDSADQACLSWSNIFASMAMPASRQTYDVGEASSSKSAILSGPVSYPVSEQPSMPRRSSQGREPRALHEEQWSRNSLQRAHIIPDSFASEPPVPLARSDNPASKDCYAASPRQPNRISDEARGQIRARAKSSGSVKHDALWIAQLCCWLWYSPITPSAPTNALGDWQATENQLSSTEQDAAELFTALLPGGSSTDPFRHGPYSDRSGAPPAYSYPFSQQEQSQLHAMRLWPKPEFVSYVKRVLEQSQGGVNLAVLGLMYIQRLKARHSRRLRLQMGTEYRVITVAFMLANKILDDNTYTNKTWATLTGFPVKLLNSMEVEFWSGLDMRIHYTSRQWSQWTLALPKFKSERVAAAHAFMMAEAARYRQILPLPVTLSPERKTSVRPYHSPQDVTRSGPLTATEQFATSHSSHPSSSSSPVQFFHNAAAAASPLTANTFTTQPTNLSAHRNSTLSLPAMCPPLGGSLETRPRLHAADPARGYQEAGQSKRKADDDSHFAYGLSSAHKRIGLHNSQSVHAEPRMSTGTFQGISEYTGGSVADFTHHDPAGTARIRQWISETTRELPYYQQLPNPLAVHSASEAAVHGSDLQERSVNHNASASINRLISHCSQYPLLPRQSMSILDNSQNASAQAHMFQQPQAQQYNTATSPTVDSLTLWSFPSAPQVPPTFAPTYQRLVPAQPPIWQGPTSILPAPTTFPQQQAQVTVSPTARFSSAMTLSHPYPHTQPYSHPHVQYLTDAAHPYSTHGHALQPDHLPHR